MRGGGLTGLVREGLECALRPQPCADGTDHCIVSIVDAITLENGGASVTSSQGVEVDSQKREGILPALATALRADVIILALGIDKSIEGEGHDRPDITLPGLQSESAAGL